MSSATIKAGAKIGSVIVSGILLTLEIIELIKKGKTPEPEVS